MGSLWVPSPSAMNELANGWPSTVPRTLTRPRVPKKAAESGMITYVQPPLLSLFCSFAVNCRLRGSVRSLIEIPFGGIQHLHTYNDSAAPEKTSRSGVNLAFVDPDAASFRHEAVRSDAAGRARTAARVRRHRHAGRPAQCVPEGN